eukprot:gnl/Spiro4/15822_TR8517_c0_g1_i1.p1 gnl/Spiro4/15822_TR8517_c0_g1~~gnl/Spiro4/15822_TR8517_c0_g1_i1.p1  ORF type:complete len:447 (-),score=100.04 gnl/Spiro4/15822_TR8517_c0_g1_i1:38-1321(-)
MEWSLFLLSCTTVLPVLLIVLASFTLKRKGILTDTAMRDIGKLMYNLFVPGLIFSEIVRAVGASTLVSLWILPVMCFFFTALGMGLGWLLVVFLRPKRFAHRRPAIVAPAFGNATFLPFSIIAVLNGADWSLSKTPGFATTASAYIAVYSILFDMMVFSIAESLLTPTALLFPSSSSSASSSLSAAEDDRLQHVDGDEEEEEEHYYDLASLSQQQQTPQQLQQQQQQQPQQQQPACSERLVNMLAPLLSPPFIAGVVAILVTLITPVRSLFYAAPGSATSVPPLSFLFSCLDVLGRATVPCGLIMLGLGISKAVDAGSNSRSNSDGPEPRMRWPLIIGIILIKLFVVPATMLALHHPLMSLGLVPADNRTLQFVLLLESTMPSAVNLVLLSELKMGQTVAISHMYLVQYSCAIITIPTLLAIIMAIV